MSLRLLLILTLALSSNACRSGAQTTGQVTQSPESSRLSVVAESAPVWLLDAPPTNWMGPAEGTLPAGRHLTALNSDVIGALDVALRATQDPASRASLIFEAPIIMTRPLNSAGNPMPWRPVAEMTSSQDSGAFWVVDAAGIHWRVPGTLFEPDPSASQQRFTSWQASKSLIQGREQGLANLEAQGIIGVRTSLLGKMLQGQDVMLATHNYYQTRLDSRVLRYVREHGCIPATLDTLGSDQLVSFRPTNTVVPASWSELGPSAGGCSSFITLDAARGQWEILLQSEGKPLHGLRYRYQYLPGGKVQSELAAVTAESALPPSFCVRAWQLPDPPPDAE